MIQALNQTIKTRAKSIYYVSVKKNVSLPSSSVFFGRCG